MIPRLIHQIFIPDEASPHDLDELITANIDSWKRLHPAHVHRLWGLPEIRELAQGFGPPVLAAIDAAAFPAMKADIARLLILLLQGGAYADLQFRCAIPFLDELGAHRLVLLEHFKMRGEARHRYLANGLILAEAGHPFLQRALADCVANVAARLDTTLWNVTGPRVLMNLQDEFLPQPYGTFVDGCGVLTEGEAYGRLVARTSTTYNRPGRHWYQREARESIYTDREAAVWKRPAAGAARPRSEADQAGFFAAALARAYGAEALAGAVDRCFEIAGAVLCVRFAGAALAQHFVPALAHLEVPAPARPDAILHVWDSQSTGTSMVPPPFTQGCLTGRGEIWTMASRRFRSAYLWGEHALALYDVATATGIYWVPSAGPMPDWARASPLRCLLHWWAQSRGLQLVHAAAVGDDRGAVLITGKSGAGKSTTALACLEQGLRYLGDDYVLLEVGPVPRVHSLYATAKLERSWLQHLPGLAALQGEHRNGDGKALLHLHPAMGEQLARSLPLRAIVTPRIAGQRTSCLEAISPRELRSAATLTTLSQLPQAGPETHELIARLIGRVPGRRLVLGSDLAAVPAALAELLAGTASGLATERAPSPPPLVSVIIPVGEDGALLEETIASVLAQTDADTELLLVEDENAESIDDLVARLPVEVRRLRQLAGGPAAASNRGIRECAGALVTFLRAGDRWPDGTLGAMLDGLLGEGGCDVVRGASLSGEPAAALYRRHALEQAGPFDERLWNAEGTGWFERAAAQGLRLRTLSRPTLLARPRDQDEARRGRLERQSLRLLKAMLDRNPARRARRPV